MDSITVSLLVIFILITCIPLLSKRIGMPVIVLEIISGILLGNSWLKLIPENQMFDFLASFGLVYLMFLAGIEVDMRFVKKHLKKTIVITAASLGVPFIAGVWLAPYVGIPPVLLGTIFCTTSLGIVLPLAKELRGRRKLRQVLLGSVISVDIVSMFVLAGSVALLEGELGWSFAYSLIAICAVFVIPFVVMGNGFQQKIQEWFDKKTFFDFEVRFSFALIFVLGALSEVFGFHSIIGGFVAGLIISEITPDNSKQEAKLKSFGYGFFIPLFFIVTGARVDVPALLSDMGTVELLLIMIVVAIGAKLVGVAAAARAQGYSWRDSTALGLFHSARLSLIIAAAEIVRREGFIGNDLFSMFVLLALVSAVVGPSIGKMLALRKPA